MLPTAQKNEGERQELGEGSRECSYDVCCNVRWGRRCGCGESSCSLTIIKFMRAEEVKLHLLYLHTQSNSALTQLSLVLMHHLMSGDTSRNIYQKI